MSKTNRFYSAVKSIFRALFDPLVVVTAMTACSLIVAVLALAWPSVSKKVFVLCFVIGAIGLVTIIYQMRRLYRMDRLKVLIGHLIAEGHHLVLEVGAGLPGRFRDFPNNNLRDKQHYDLMAEWCGRVEIVLRQYFDESHVSRFHLGGSSEQDATSMNIWKMNHRLETLASFLTELK